jgi:hypothetical protein
VGPRFGLDVLLMGIEPQFWGPSVACGQSLYCLSYSGTSLSLLCFMKIDSFGSDTVISICGSVGTGCPDGGLSCFHLVPAKKFQGSTFIRSGHTVA